MVNNKLFRVKAEKFHPVIDKYARVEFWRKIKRHCMEGYWVGGKWMCGELFYYINFHNIIKETGIYKSLGLPDLRDIDWELFNIFQEAIGFSGFSDDKDITCHRAIQALNNKELTKEEVIRYYCTYLGVVDNALYSNLFKANGEAKKYVSTRDYINKEHGKNLGKPLYQNEAKHLFLLGSRGFGKSYSASGLIAHNFLFDGAHDYDLYLDKVKKDNRLKSETGVGAIDAKYSGDLLNKTKTALDHLPDSHILSDIRGSKVYPSLLAKRYKGSFTASNAVTALDSFSTIHHRTLRDNPLVFNGLRPNRMFLDEAGFINNILEAWEAIENTQAVESFKRLTIFAMGTGGLNSGSAVTYAKKIFYDPESYNCLVFNDHWENKGKICYFVSAVKALNKFKEGPNLITNEKRALEAINNEREKATKSKDSVKIKGTIINKPIKPSEVFLRMGGNFFPTRELTEVLAELESDNIKLKSSYKVDLIEKSKGKVIPVPSEKIPITNYPLLKGDNMDACIEIFKKPKPTRNNSIGERYIAACLLPGNKVVTDKGLKNVEEVTTKDKLVNSKGDLVNILTFQHLKVKEEPVYTISMSDTSIKTTFTGEHPLLLSTTKNNFKFVKVANAKVGYWAKVPNIYRKVVTPNFKKLIANKEVTTTWKRLYNHSYFYRVLGIEIRNRLFPNTVDLSMLRANKVAIKVLNLKGKDINSFIDGFTNIKNIYIPEWFKYINHENKNCFLQGLLNDRGLLNLTIESLEEYKKLSPELYEYIYNMLLSIGICITKEDTCFKDKDYNYIYFRITNIETTKYTGSVYNFECKTHTYMCHHITTHNCDPVDDDGNNNHKRSLQSTFILDSWTDELVAEYTARTYLAKDYYENVRLLCMYYNARLLYENNKKGLYAHFNIKNSLMYLAETPEILRDKDYIKSIGVGNRSLGVNMSNERIKLYGLQLLLEYLEAPAYNFPELKNLQIIRSIGALKEMIDYSLDINADRVSALIVLAIYRKELTYKIESIKHGNIKTTADSDIWSRAYRKFNSNKVYNNYKNYSSKSMFH